MGATERWRHVLNSPITNFNILYIDKAKYIPSQITIDFKNREQIHLLIAPELNLDYSLPLLEYSLLGKLYVFIMQAS